MAQTSINIRIDKNLKQDFETVCNEIGLTMSAAFNVFAKVVTTRKEIPFKLTTRQIITQDEEWGHLSSGDLLTPAEVAGVAGEWNNDIHTSLKGKSAWSEAVEKKEIRKKKR
jgi:addiction module RelB/DinJ family antitoxin